MTYFTASRSNVAARIAGFPFLVAAYALKAAWAEITTEVAALRTDFVPAVRYVVTGEPDKSVAAHASDKAVSVRDRIAQVYTDHAHDRLVCLLFLLFSPILFVLAVVWTLQKEEFFSDFFGSIRDVAVNIVRGEDWREI